MAQSIPWTVAEILQAADGVLAGGSRDPIFEGVSIDSRAVSAENLFVAIKGERHDGHSFVKDVIEKGVQGAVISKAMAGMFLMNGDGGAGPAFIAVDDPCRALGRLAHFNRTRAGVSVVGVTGSNGKTTTRKMTAAVVRRRFPTLTPRGNFNNEIGLPLTLLNLNRKHRWAVLELGANHPGEIANLSRICRPNIAVVTNVGPAHLEGFGSLEGVAAAKGEILDHTAPGATAVLNADDRRVADMAARARGDVLFYGVSEKAEIRASDIETTPRGCRFILNTPAERTLIEIKRPGAFMVSNALAAAAVGFLIGLGATEIKTALEVDFQPAPGRMNIVETPGGLHLIDDAYNANPESMRGALEALANLKGGRRGVFVAGDMFELGEHAPSLHEQLGKTAADSGVARLYAAGANAAAVARGAKAAGMDSADIFTGEKEEILADLKQWLRPGDWVLVKGSRGMRMEQIVEALKQETYKQ